MTFPIPVIVLFIVWQVLNFIGLACFHYDAKHKNVVPEARYKGREKQWWWGFTLSAPIAGCAHFFFHIIIMADKIKKRRAEKKAAK